MGYKTTEEATAASRRWRENNPDKVYAYQWEYSLRKMGITPEEYEILTSDNKCWLCKKTPPVRMRKGKETRSLVIDHDHTCCPEGRACENCVRGFLCQKCNVFIGWVEENDDCLDDLFAYLADPPLRSKLKELRS